MKITTIVQRCINWLKFNPKKFTSIISLVVLFTVYLSLDYDVEISSIFSFSFNAAEYRKYIYSEFQISMISKWIEPKQNIILWNNEIWNFADISDGFLVYNSKCHIPSLNLTNRAMRKFIRKMEFEPCRSTPLLSSIVEQTNGRHSLVINPSVAETYGKFICCWSSITRPTPTNLSLKDYDSKIR